MVREAFTDSPQATEGQHLQLGGELHEGKVPLRAIWSGPREDATGATDSLQAFNATEAPQRMPRGVPAPGESAGEHRVFPISLR